MDKKNKSQEMEEFTTITEEEVMIPNESIYMGMIAAAHRERIQHTKKAKRMKIIHYSLNITSITLMCIVAIVNGLSVWCEGGSDSKVCNAVDWGVFICAGLAALAASLGVLDSFLSYKTRMAAHKLAEGHLGNFESCLETITQHTSLESQRDIGMKQAIDGQLFVVQQWHSSIASTAPFLGTTKSIIKKTKTQD